MSSAPTLIRPLSPSESMFAEAGIYVSYSTRVTGGIDTAALREAFAALRRTYPVLATRIRSTGPGQSVLEDDGMSDYAVTGGTAEDDVLSGLPDLGGKAAALHVVSHDADTSSVTLLTHHSIADGRHSLRLLADLWSNYTAIVEGRPLDLVVRPYPDSAETLLSERGFVLEESAWSMPAMPENARSRDTEVLPARARFTAEETEALRSTARRMQTTINGLISAALLQTTADSQGVDVGDLLYVYPVDLRTRVTPPIGLTEGTNVLGLARFVAESGFDTSGASTGALARAVVDQLAQGLSTGEVQRATMRLPADPEALVTLLPTMVISTNWGVVPELRTPAGVSVTDFHPGMAPIVSDIPMAGMPSSTIITTFEGQLTLDSTVGPAEVADVARRMRDLL
ncbi:phthiocerol/phthiodiolone dimycocerosyl transferase family protein [Nocardia terpenica]|uniref:Phthiocerol/phthiodiolone dimycocerosyl transferase n=1 Tax=Nocardia terpenica TaxID=455432 RepID=A0A291RM48_9NOCA|nr:hypothetical protein [Nocardia terpenica]ATL68234.1 hypothetical protein CRH09_20665 [Nocardia terpenica]